MSHLTDLRNAVASLNEQSLKDTACYDAVDGFEETHKLILSMIDSAVELESRVSAFVIMQRKGEQYSATLVRGVNLREKFEEPFYLGELNILRAVIPNIQKLEQENSQLQALVTSLQLGGYK